MTLQGEETHNLLNSLLNQKYSHFLSHHFHLCALILALLATVLIIPFRQNPHSRRQSLITDDDFDFTDDDDDESISPPSTSSEFEDDDEEEEEEEERTSEYFRVRGSSGGFTRRRSIADFLSLSEIAESRSVVKLWDTIGFGFESFGHSATSSGGSVVSVYEVQGLRPVPTGMPPTGDVSPAVVVSAGESASGKLALRIWDTRLRCRVPAVMAEWVPSLGKTVELESGEIQKVYVSDDGRFGLTVGDMTNVTLPLENETEPCLDLWWPNSFITPKSKFI